MFVFTYLAQMKTAFICLILNGVACPNVYMCRPWAAWELQFISDSQVFQQKSEMSSRVFILLHPRNYFNAPKSL